MIREKLQAIIDTLTAALPDASRVDAGQTSSPATRVRAAALAGKESLHELRKEISALRGEKE